MNFSLLVLYCNFTVLSIDQSLTPQHFQEHLCYFSTILLLSLVGCEAAVQTQTSLQITSLLLTASCQSFLCEIHFCQLKGYPQSPVYSSRKPAAGLIILNKFLEGFPDDICRSCSVCHQTALISGGKKKAPIE